MDEGRNWLFFPELTPEETKWLDAQKALVRQSAFDASEFTQMWNEAIEKEIGRRKPPTVIKVQLKGV